MAIAKKRERNNKKNLKRKLKRQAESAVVLQAPAQLTPLQRLQMLIGDLEEYVPPHPTGAIPLNEYIPWDEIEKRTHLKKWIHEMIRRVKEGGHFSIPEELSLFYKDKEITAGQLEELL